MKLQQLLKKLNFKFNKFTIVGIVFLVWISLFDRHNFINQIKLKNIINELEDEKADLEQKIVEAKQDKIDMDLNKEKFAREKYHMHKDNEEVYIIKK
jgi:hypothetical protein